MGCVIVIIVLMVLGLVFLFTVSKIFFVIVSILLAIPLLFLLRFILIASQVIARSNEDELDKHGLGDVEDADFEELE